MYIEATDSELNQSLEAVRHDAAHVHVTVPDAKLALRRERVFMILVGIFLGSLTMLNILGITRFLDLSFELFGMKIPFAVAVGVLPYPITFLCTDFISEFYGQRRANFLVWVGLLLNLWVVLILWLGRLCHRIFPWSPIQACQPWVPTDVSFSK